MRLLYSTCYASSVYPFWTISQKYWPLNKSFILETNSHNYFPRKLEFVNSTCVYPKWKPFNIFLLRPGFFPKPALITGSNTISWELMNTTINLSYHAIINYLFFSFPLLGLWNTTLGNPTFYFNINTCDRNLLWPGFTTMNITSTEFYCEWFLLQLNFTATQTYCDKLLCDMTQLSTFCSRHFLRTFHLTHFYLEKHPLNFDGILLWHDLPVSNLVVTNSHFNQTPFSWTL